MQEERSSARTTLLPPAAYMVASSTATCPMTYCAMPSTHLLGGGDRLGSALRRA